MTTESWKKFKDFAKKNYLIGVILLVAASIRILGITFNLPAVGQVDEPNIIVRAIDIARGKYANPHWYNWPANSLMYLNASSFWLAEQFTKLIGKHITLSHFTILGRILTVIFALIGITCTYAIGKIFFSKRTGLIAAFALSVAFLHVKSSRFVTPDVPLTTIGTAIVLMSMLYYQKRKRLYLLLASLLLGIAMSTKWIGLLFALPIIISYLLTKPWKKLNVQTPALSMVFFFVGMTLFMPFWWQDVREIITALIFEARPNHFGADWGGQGNIYLKNFITYLKIQRTLGEFFAWGGLLGLTLLIKRTMQKKEYVFLIVIITPLFYLLCMADLRLHWARWGVPLLPYTALFGAFFLDTLWKYIQKKNTTLWHKRATQTAFATLLLFLFLTPTIRSFSYGFRDVNRATNRNYLIEDWIDKNIPKQSRIVKESKNIPLALEKYKVNTTGKTLTEEKPYSVYKKEGYEYFIMSHGKTKQAITKKYTADPQKKQDTALYVVQHGKRIYSSPQDRSDLPSEDRKFYPWLFHSANIKNIWRAYTGDVHEIYYLPLEK